MKINFLTEQVKIQFLLSLYLVFIVKRLEKWKKKTRDECGEVRPFGEQESQMQVQHGGETKDGL